MGFKVQGSKFKVQGSLALDLPVWQSLALDCARKRALSILPIGVILAAS